MSDISSPSLCRCSLWQVLTWLLWKPRGGGGAVSALSVQQQHRHVGPRVLWRPNWRVSALPLPQRGYRLPELQVGLLRQRLAAELQEWVHCVETSTDQQRTVGPSTDQYSNNACCQMIKSIQILIKILTEIWITSQLYNIDRIVTKYKRSEKNCSLHQNLHLNYLTIILMTF